MVAGMDSGSVLLPHDDLELLRDELRRFGHLAMDREIALSLLVEAAATFLVNRREDEESLTVGRVHSSLEGLLVRSRRKLAINVKQIPDHAIEALFGTFPGASLALTIGEGCEGARVAGIGSPIVSEIVKTLWRHGTDSAEPTGLVQVRRTSRLADSIPPAATVEELTQLLTGIIRNPGGPGLSIAVRERRILHIAHRLIAAGSFGSTVLFTALGRGFGEAGNLEERTSFVSDIVHPILADLQDRIDAPEANPARGLAGLIVEEYLDGASWAERRNFVLSFSDVFPDALRQYVRTTCEGLDHQYRIDGNPQQRRRNTRRWTEPHASWQLIRDVLDVVWPAERGALPAELKDPVTAIAAHVLLYADRDLPAESDIVSKIPFEEVAGPGRSDRNGVHNRANFTINREHVEKVGLWRAQISVLDGALLKLDRDILFGLDPKGESDPAAKAEARRKRGHVDALQTWRFEIDQRLRQGDYEKDVRGKPRATGRRIVLPVMPLHAPGELSDSQIDQFVEAASILAR